MNKKIVITESQYQRFYTKNNAGKESDLSENEVNNAVSEETLPKDKESMLDILNNSNKMHDSYHNGIRDINDIKYFDEAMFTNNEEGFVYPDFTEKDAIECKNSGKIVIYSSHPIKLGTFVTPSRMNAKDYAGSEEIYSKIVDINSVAWITSDEGEYIG